LSANVFCQKWQNVVLCHSTGSFVWDVSCADLRICQKGQWRDQNLIFAVALVVMRKPNKRGYHLLDEKLDKIGAKLIPLSYQRPGQPQGPPGFS